MKHPSEGPIPGVSGLDHTADVGLEIVAPTLAELFRRAALGTMWLILERIPDEKGTLEIRRVEIVEGELPHLLRSWVRRLLLWQEADGFVALGSKLAFFPSPLCGVEDGQAFGLRGMVEGVMDAGPVVREIKGVTLHDLRLEKQGDGWYGRVIMDV